MPTSVLTVSYIAASALFILSLGGLSRQETARRGNTLGMIGMLIAVAATAAHVGLSGSAAAAVVLVPGALIGAALARRVAMESMPQLVAILHSFVGLAAVLVGFANYLEPGHVLFGAARSVHLIEVFVGVFIGAFTFTGSVVAWGKLDRKIGSAPLMIPGRHALNLTLLLACVGAGYLFVAAPGTDGLLYLGVMSVIASLLGVHLVMAIGGADMPVVVSMLNSYSGWAASAAGFMLSNDLLIITGALVGSSGAILSYIMCRAMNRSFLSVILGGFGVAEGVAPPPRAEGDVEGVVQEIDVDGAVGLLREAREVVIVPGYGMAVAQAQHPMQEITRLLQARGARVRFAIHPVAGRLPGHMNVLLAEARVPYDIVLELDEINDDLGRVDVVLVIGANDIVNPDALENPASPIAGMPVLEVWESRTVVVMKRSLASGYAGIENPLFLRENTRMLFGDARVNCDALLVALRG